MGFWPRTILISAVILVYRLHSMNMLFRAMALVAEDVFGLNATGAYLRALDAQQAEASGDVTLPVEESVDDEFAEDL